MHLQFKGIVRFVLNFNIEMKLQIFFDRPQHLSNLMTSFRTMEILGFRNCVINDRYTLLDKPWTNDLMRKMRSYSAGAEQYINYEISKFYGTSLFITQLIYYYY